MRFCLVPSQIWKLRGEPGGLETQRIRLRIQVTMKIAVDINGLYVTKAGTSRYIEGLLRGFQQLNSADCNISQVAWQVENLGYRQPIRMLKTFYRELIWAKFLAPGILRKRGACLYHATSTLIVTPPLGIGWVATLHDVAVLRHPERFRRWHLQRTVRNLRKLHKVDRIAAISQFTADEAIKLLGLPSKKFEVIRNGCDFHPDEPPPLEEPPSMKLPSEYFLFVGSLEPGKNLGLLTSVYHLAGERKIALPPLVIVGARWQGVTAEKAPPKDWHYLGHVPDRQLVYLYRRALALVFPSKYEGFGLPVVEAMALGCPVICSPVASLPEVAGGAALFADMVPDAYLAALLRMMEDRQRREEMIQAGKVQAARFSWRKCAKEMLGFYRNTTKSERGFPLHQAP